MGKAHGSIARAGKVRSQTPKVAKTEKPKSLNGRAKKRLLYNRFVFLRPLYPHALLIPLSSRFVKAKLVNGKYQANNNAYVYVVSLFHQKTNQIQCPSCRRCRPRGQVISSDRDHKPLHTFETLTQSLGILDRSHRVSFIALYSPVVAA